MTQVKQIFRAISKSKKLADKKWRIVYLANPLKDGTVSVILENVNDTSQKAHLFYLKNNKIEDLQFIQSVKN